MNADQWPQMIEYATYSTWTTISDQLPNILGAILILILGFMLGGVAKGIIMTLTKKLQVDDAFASTGARDTLNRAGVHVSIGAILGSLVTSMLRISLKVLPERLFVVRSRNRLRVRTWIRSFPSMMMVKTDMRPTAVNGQWLRIFSRIRILH